MAPSGHALTQAGAWPCSRRPWHMSHLPTTPRSGLYCGTPYEQFHVQYLAADAGVGAVVHDAGDGVLGVGVDRTAAHTRRVDALIAAHREIGPVRIGIPAAFDLADAAPVDRRRVAVLLVARDDAALAPDAAAHVEVKPVLFAGARRARRHPSGERARVGGVHRGEESGRPYAEARRHDEGHALVGDSFQQGQRHDSSSTQETNHSSRRDVAT